MQSLNEAIREYTFQLQRGQIQIAYKGIMTFMSAMKSFLENRHPDFAASGLYFGYMDMTYFAFTPPELKQRNLKIAIVFLHAENRFDAWLGGVNRKVQGEFVEFFRGKDIGDLILSEVKPGVDSIVEMGLVQKPDFDHQEELMLSIESQLVAFTEKINNLLPA